MKKLILASGSPRRREILSDLGLTFTVQTADTKEDCTCQNPGEFVETLATRKGRAVAKLQTEKNFILLACDTVVAVDGKILGKPKDRADAKKMLCALMGKTHEVMTGIYLTDGEREKIAHETTKVTFDEIPTDVLERYLDTDEPYDKAGGYAIQGWACKYISRMDGDYFNVVGLPVHLFNQMYRELTGTDLS